MKGTIKMVAQKGFGFIAPDDGTEDIFFHATNLKEMNFDDVKIGMAVSFDVIDGNRGLKAMAIELDQDA